MNSQHPSLHLEEIIDRAIGRKLVAMRLSAKLTREELANLAELPLEELIEHEQGRLSLPLARLPILCEAMGCHTGHLVRAARRAYRRAKAAHLSR